MRHCAERSALNTWKKLGPIRLSELALQSDVTVDLDDEKYELEMPSASDEDQVVRVVPKDGSDPEVQLIRSIGKNGQIHEGFLSHNLQYYARVIFHQGFYYVGQWKNQQMDGVGTEYDDKCRIIQKGLWVKGKLVNRLGHLDY